MATSTSEIANLALSHLGSAKTIVTLETERSEEAQACRAFYETTRNAVLEDFPWPFATRNVALALVASDPTEEWLYSYRYPSSCVTVRKIISAASGRIRNKQAAEKFRVASDSTGKLIYTDYQTPTVEYTHLITDVTQFSAAFVLAFSYRLASYIAPRITRGDQFKLGERSMKMYLLELSKARANAAGEEEPDELADSEFVRMR